MVFPLSYIEINKEAVRKNVQAFREYLKKEDVSIIAVVKANAYGHGLREVVLGIEDMVEAFQVDDIDELRKLREYTEKKAYVFGYVQLSDLNELVSLGGIPGVYAEAQLDVLQAIGAHNGALIEVHLKIDALLGRQGILISELEQFASLFHDRKQLRLGAIYSHFSNIEDVDDLLHAKKQEDILLKAKEILRTMGFSSIGHHVSATSGILVDPMNWGGEYARLGIGLYGLWPSVALKERYGKRVQLVPALRWVSHIAQVKTLPPDFPVGYGLTYMTKTEMKVAIIPQGYSDGYDRGLSNTGVVLVGGMRCPVIGRVAMNMFAVDVTRIASVSAGDEVVLLGGQGEEEITAEEHAERTGTINYEVVARISPLLPRVVI